ncbi:dihydrolipoyllysine-residue acetyltransferase component 5 of pyruvate dehydrogenase complex, chloroplastic-like isoform X2 [Selaginella moellendorffii]|uniref:dihydrolipoyllysine-residue acetyltransferase component 5 of pyruvate dehydrogenase complex, chloroplastic-like isoform X2 n=1 Tax=Selaginella moellendorffii TaxID=88036 RepID=UPI000D1C69E6|nr:dihydrolipoyllysine-residue acetyltransferase component 5 of pyruvate dehydrogenase complex, chloroplastic-like isoform X2 [Selaginella moellendorffii]|eukprot:XP_024522157.1 dihydrolipoyllysine-residue acetyltransferase component 5 of pyruvate dehydrogenase complex, chloroplastic-like isoform X2 [Selaginella moellendorffii]
MVWWISLMALEELLLGYTRAPCPRHRRDCCSRHTMLSGRAWHLRPLVSLPVASRLHLRSNITFIGIKKEIVCASASSADDSPSEQAPSLADLQTFASTTISELMKEEKKLDGALLRHDSDTVLPFTTLQTLISEYMVESLSVPTFRVGYTITTTALDILYQQIKCKGVTMTALLAKATALALAQHPVVNARCKDGKSISYNSSIDLAVVVAIDGGLITPVLQNADKIDIYSLSREWKKLVKKARAKQLQISECMGETFTISNMGMFGVDRFDGGQSAILAVSSSRPTIVTSGAGLFRVESQIQVNVTADARIIYEAEVAAFLQTLSKIIKDPKDLTL